MTCAISWTQIDTGAVAARGCVQFQVSRQKYPPTAPSTPPVAEIQSLLQSSLAEARVSPSWAAVFLNGASWLHVCECQSGPWRSACSSTNRFPPYDCCLALMQQRQKMTVEMKKNSVCIEFVIYTLMSGCLNREPLCTLVITTRMNVSVMVCFCYCLTNHFLSVYLTFLLHKW